MCEAFPLFVKDIRFVFDGLILPFYLWFEQMHSITTGKIKKVLMFRTINYMHLLRIIMYKYALHYFVSVYKYITSFSIQ